MYPFWCDRLCGCTGIREAELITKFSRFLDLDDYDESGLSSCQG